MESKEIIEAELIDEKNRKYDGRANLIPAKKGEVRNPNGRPKGSKNKATICKEIAQYAEQQGWLIDGIDAETASDPLALIYMIALNPKTPVSEALKAAIRASDEKDGKPVQRVEVKDQQEVIMIKPEDTEL